MGLTTIRRYLTPSTIEEALGLKREHGTAARFVAGGTDVVLHPDGADTLIDLQHLSLAGISVVDDGIDIGAMTTLTTVLESADVGAVLHGVIHSMLLHVGSPLLRNVATLGGHLARGKLSDIVPVLIAADGDVRWFADGDQSSSLEEYYATGAYLTDHVLQTIHVPAWGPMSGAGFTRFARAAFDLAIVNVAVRVTLADDGRVTTAAVVVGNAPGPYVNAAAAAAALVGDPLTDASIRGAATLAAGDPGIGGDGRAAEDYRRHLVGVLTRRSLVEAAGHLGVTL